MGEDYGFLSIHRQISNHWLWKDKPFSKGQAWIDLIMLANHTTVKTMYKDEIVECKRGDVNFSMSYLAERWGWDRKKVSRFLNALETDEMVFVNSNTHRTIITIRNYDKFQKKKKGSKQYGLGYMNGTNDMEKAIKSLIQSQLSEIELKENTNA